MFQGKLAAFFIGLLIAGVTLGVRLSPSGWDLAILVSVIAVAVVAALWIFSAKVLIKWSQFRRWVFRGHAKYEGQWATDLAPDSKLRHPDYPYSFAEIEYDDAQDRFTYSGVAFDTEGSPHASWTAYNLVHDAHHKCYLFLSFGEMPADDRSVQNVKGLGCLNIGANDDVMPGYVKESGGKAGPFDMVLYRISGKDLDDVLGKKTGLLKPRRKITTNADKLRLVQATLRRVGRLS